MASNWYINAINGGANSAGTAATTPWNGFAAAYATLATADTAAFTKPWNVYVAPCPTGYHGQVIPTGSVVGADSANGTYYFGDVNCTSTWSAGINPGEVRVTLADANEVPQTGTAVVLGATVAHQYFYDMTFDGVAPATSANNTTILGSTASCQTFIRCKMIGAYRGAYRVRLEDCVVISSGSAVIECRPSGSDGYVKRCLLMSHGQNTSVDTVKDSEASNCIVIGGSGLTINCGTATVENSLIISPDRTVVSLNVAGSPVNNNIIMLSAAAFRYSAAVAGPNLMFMCNKDAVDASPVITSCRQIYTCLETASSPAGDGHVFTLPPAKEMVSNIAKAFNINIYRDYDATSVAPISTLDIEGRARTGYTGTYCCPGPIQFYEQTLIKDSTNGNEIQISKAGEEVLYVPLKKTATATIGISCTYINGDTAPQVALVFDPLGGVATKTATAANYAGHSFAIAITAADVPFDQTAKLILKGMATTATATCIFHSLTIT